MSSVTYLFRGPTRPNIFAKPNAVEKQGDDLENDEDEWTLKVEIKTVQKFLAVGEACMAIP